MNMYYLNFSDTISKFSIKTDLQFFLLVSICLFSYQIAHALF